MVASGKELADKMACAELIQAWGLYRDQGRWKELRATFTPDGHISVSWFRGPFELVRRALPCEFRGRSHLVAPSPFSARPQTRRRSRRG